MTYNRVNIAFYLTQNYNTHINIFASNAKEINNITNIIAHHTHIILIKCNNKNLLYQKYLL
jgi:abortive infection bacteriophage resistance protein